MVDKPRPYLNAALLCEKVLQEKDGSLSAIRIADTVQLQTVRGEVPADFKPVFNLTCLLVLKSGPVTGDHLIRLSLMTPGGQPQGTPIDTPITMAGKDQGQNLVVNLFFSTKEEGLHWIHVWFDDIEMTRIPLTVVPQKRLQEQT